MPGEFFEIEMETLTTWEHGLTAIKNSWWATRNGKPVGYKPTPKAKHAFPQCNANEEIAVRIAKVLGLEAPIFIEEAFWRFEEE